MKNNFTIAIASGKGGTGKTTIATNLAYALQRTESVQLIDCDVEEPNSHLFLHPFLQNNETVGISTPVVTQEQCIACGRCRDFCVYNAITLLDQTVMVFPELCHGCGGCSFICPTHAISEEQRPIGIIEEGIAKNIFFLHGVSNIGNALSPPIINALKEKVSQEMLTILDAPPGTSCPVVTTLEGTDYVILVTEPTPFGLHDLQLTVQVVRKLGIPFGVIINRADLGNALVEEYCQSEKISILLKVGFHKEYAISYARGEMIIDKDPQLGDALCEMYQEIVRRMSG
ncbi:MAG: ATP-binding protein [Desulfobacterales bacterium]|nr:ATP-binding protein [Desulfobacterales bacterium]